MLLPMQQATNSQPHTKDEAARRLLARGGLIDITTTGRRTKRPRRIEIVFHNIDGRIFISGMPRAERKRAWIVNLEADPHMTIHLKGPLAADLPATARVVAEPAERRTVAEWIVRHAWPRMNVEAMAAYSPMIEVTLDQVA
jgi:deazaflavin-dependent oxidoreductase (nitroreductase family)